MKNFLYFAYGSNMSQSQIERRCPRANFAGRALLPDFDFSFTRFSRNRQCGVIDIVKSPGSVVWGVLFSLTAEGLATLDRCEGYKEERKKGNAYRRFEVEVWKEGQRENALMAYTYEVESKVSPPVLTSPEYKKLVLQGAREWNLPGEYLHRLEGISTWEEE